MRAKQKKTPEEVKEWLQDWQQRIIWLLYGAMALKCLAAFFPIFDFPSGVLLFVFFALEVFFLPPLGMLIMCLFASVMFFFLPILVVWLVAFFIASLILAVLGLAVTAILSGIVITVVGGIVASIEVISITAPAAIGVGIAAAAGGTGYAAAAGTAAATAKVGEKVVEHTRARMIKTMLCSLLVLLVVGWPALSYSGAINGGLAFKPTAILSRAHLNYLNYNASEDYKELFEDENHLVFRSGFYAKYINNGRNDISQGGTTLIAGDDAYLAIVLDGLLYIQRPSINRMDLVTGYLPRKTDAMVIADNKVFIFGRNKVFCAGKDGHYTWKKTNWTTEFERLSLQEQFDRLYDILERQNTDEPLCFSYDEAAVVAYAQRTGLLINYDADTHCAWFAQTDSDGAVTVWEQNTSGQREEQVTFTPVCSGDGVPYVMVGTRGILYLHENQVKYLQRSKDWAENNHYTLPECGDETHTFASLHYMDLGKQGEYLVYVDEADKICLDTALIGLSKVTLYDFDGRNNRVSGSAYNYIYTIQYEYNPLSVLTFINDIDNEVTNWRVTRIRQENWNSKRIELQKSFFVEVEEETEEPDPAALYPAPTVSTRNRDSYAYEKSYIAANYSTYTGPQQHFKFGYPPSLYEEVEYGFENDGADIDILFTRSDDGSYLSVSVHPLPENTEDLKAYAQSLYDQEQNAIYNGMETVFKEYPDDGEYRFRIQGWTEMNSGLTSMVICCVNNENVMRLELHYPNGTDDEDKKVKNFYADRINYLCGFGIPSKAPTIS